MRLQQDRIASPVGPLLIVSDEAGALHAIVFGGQAAGLARALFERRETMIEAPAPPRVRDALERYFAGELGAVDALPLRPHGTPFQTDVWTALRTIPPGTTLSYGALARRLGRPGAARAVGLANGANPIPIVTPCHRVIGASGALTGFGGGLERKRWLLAHEARHAGAPDLFSSPIAPMREPPERDDGPARGAGAA